MAAGTAASVDPAAASVPEAPVMEVSAEDRSNARPIREDPGSAVPLTADQAFLATKFLIVVASTVASSALVLVSLTVVMATHMEPAHGEKIVGKTTFQQLEVENSCQV